MTELDRLKRISERLNLKELPFEFKEKNIKELSTNIHKFWQQHFKDLDESATCLKWCTQTIKKLKVFTIIVTANEKGEEIYKEEIAKKLPQYSYKTIASIIDEGVTKGYYINLLPTSGEQIDKKIKNIRPSEYLEVEFLNWQIKLIKYSSILLND